MAAHAQTPGAGSASSPAAAAKGKKAGKGRGKGKAARAALVAAVNGGGVSGAAEAGEPRWLSPREQEAWRAYLRGSRELVVALEGDLSAYGVSLPEYELISMLSEAPSGEQRMSTLADFIVQSRSRVTHTAVRLEKRGWVTRRPAPEDGRGVIITLTDEGWAVLRVLARVHIESVRRHLVDVLTPAQFAALGDAMQSVRDANTRSGAELTRAH